MPELENSNLIYLPPPAPVFSDFEKRLRDIVGECPTGETYIRFRWAMDITERWGDEEVYRYPDSSEPAKYVAMPYFVMEGWQSSDVYDPFEWEQNKDVLGEFPTRGVWDFIEILRGDDGETVPLGSLALDKAYETRFWRSKGAKRAVSDLLERRRRVRELQDKRFAAKKDLILDNFVRDFSNAERNIKNADFSFSAKTKGERGYKKTDSGLYIPD